MKNDFLLIFSPLPGGKQGLKSSMEGWGLEWRVHDPGMRVYRELGVGGRGGGYISPGHFISP